MQKLSEIISKNIYSLATGTKVGYVLNAILDEKLCSIKSLVVVDEESEQEAEIDFASAQVGKDGIFIASENQIKYSTINYDERILGKIVFSRQGDYLGKIKEIFLFNGKIRAINTQFISFFPKNISIFGKDVIILGGKKIKKIEQKNIERDVFSPQPLDTLVSISPVAMQKDAPLSTPFRVTSDPNSLLGKMATRDIFGLNNELIIKKFEIISAKKINEAKKHNKLNLLFYNCK